VKVNVKKVSATEREMEFELAWKDIEKDYAKFTKKFAKDIALPGFRKGMVPMGILEKKFGPQMDYDFINDSFSDYYVKALDQEELNPVCQIRSDAGLGYAGISEWVPFGKTKLCDRRRRYQ
jgi:trigger factor